MSIIKENTSIDNSSASNSLWHWCVFCIAAVRGLCCLFHILLRSEIILHKILNMPAVLKSHKKTFIAGTLKLKDLYQVNLNFPSDLRYLKLFSWNEFRSFCVWTSELESKLACIVRLKSLLNCKLDTYWKY